MKRLFIITFLLANTFFYAQSENDKKIFLDSLWEETTEGDHKYFRIIKDYSLEQEKYKFYEYHNSGEIYREGFSRGNAYMTLDGEIKEYYKNGELKRIYNTKNSIKNGTIIEWYENGVIKFEGEYTNEHNDALVSNIKIINFWDSVNNQTVKNGFGKLIIDNDEVEEKGMVKNYLKEGVWEGFDKKLKLKFSESYNEGRLITGKSTDSDNITYNYNVISTNPSPKDGYKDFYSFVGSKIKLPNLKDSISGRVILSFIVNKEGEIIEIYILKSLQPEIDNSTIAVLKKYGKWIPGTIRGKNVRVRYALPFKIDIK